MIFKDVVLVFPLLVFFLAGGACGVVLVAPRLGWYRPAAAVPVQRWQDSADVLKASVSVTSGCGRDTIAELRSAALEQGYVVYGEDAQLCIEAVGALGYINGKVHSIVVVRRLPDEESCS